MIQLSRFTRNSRIHMIHFICLQRRSEFRITRLGESLSFELGFQFCSSDFSQLNLSAIFNKWGGGNLVQRWKNDVMKFLVRLSVIQLKCFDRVFVECFWCSTTHPWNNYCQQTRIQQTHHIHVLASNSCKCRTFSCSWRLSSSRSLSMDASCAEEVMHCQLLDTFHSLKDSLWNIPLSYLSIISSSHHDFATFCTWILQWTPNLFTKLGSQNSWVPSTRRSSVLRSFSSNTWSSALNSCANATQNPWQKNKTSMRKPNVWYYYVRINSVIHLKQVETKIQRLKSLNHSNHGSLSSPGNMHWVA